MSPGSPASQSREARAASRRELRARVRDCADVCEGRRLSPIKMCDLLLSYLEDVSFNLSEHAAWRQGRVTNMKDALMNCWQSSVALLLHTVSQLMASMFIYTYIYHKEAEGIYYSSFVHLIRINYSFMLPLLLKKRATHITE